MGGVAAEVQQMDLNCSRVGESFATHVSHSGAFALDSAAGNGPRPRVCLFPWTMDVSELVVK